jgi:hypothetical protein
VPTELRVWLRRVAARPAAFVAAVASLALGMGAVVSVHALVEATLIEPIHGVTLDGLVAARQGNDRDSYEWYRSRDVEAFRERRDLFVAVAAHGHQPPDLLVETGTSSAPASILMVTANYFSTLYVSMAIGRSFLAEDERPDALPVAILSTQFWRSRFAEDPTVIGQQIESGASARPWWASRRSGSEVQTCRCVRMCISRSS